MLLYGHPGSQQKANICQGASRMESNSTSTSMDKQAVPSLSILTLDSLQPCGLQVHQAFPYLGRYRVVTQKNTSQHW